jgi:hypothetical protein
MLVTAKSVLLPAIVVCSVGAFRPKVIGPGLGPEYTSDCQLLVDTSTNVPRPFLNDVCSVRSTFPEDSEFGVKP